MRLDRSGPCSEPAHVFQDSTPDIARQKMALPSSQTYGEKNSPQELIPT